MILGENFQPFKNPKALYGYLVKYVKGKGKDITIFMPTKQNSHCILSQLPIPIFSLFQTNIPLYSKP